ncbi:hypothetical protein [Streptomyces katsurahamanus]|uniref:MarR family transcriptional regulator n=1 Tax=Streptomyces katsurahamanus TaxID=2577098 RepID=A0ABW9NYG3_9ACTN|nr:hypothetical protein [Streptomyces katsurahamanus]MQS38376.1 hypothetical protein [Streptomyces katsurahamanus]
MKADENGFEVTQEQGGWVIHMWWPTGPVSGGPQRITIEKAEDAPAREVARGISTTVLRRLDLAGAVKLVEENAPQAQEALEDVAGALNQLGTMAGLLLEREGVSAAYLAVLVSAYKGMSDSGAPAPVPWLARLIGRRPETVKGHLKQARRDGYLTTVTGKAGGELTDKAKAALSAITEPGQE